MVIYATIYQILILFLTMVIGYAAKKRGYMDPQLNKGLSNLILQVALPALIIKSMQFPFSKDLFMDSVKIVGISLMIYSIAIVFSYLYTKLIKVEGTKKDIYQFVLIFSNVAFIGYPIIDAIYGDLGVFYTALYNIPFNFLLFTIGVYIMCRNTSAEREKMDYKKILLQPGILAVLLGFTLFLFSLQLPEIIYETLDIIGSTTTPLSMLMIGGFLADIPVKEVLREEKIMLLALARLFILPILAWGILYTVGLRGVLLGVPVVITGMPAAANAAVFATLYDSDHYLASKSVFITTLLSLISIPLLTLIV